MGCRPECVLNSECPRNRACINRKCVDPCIGVCAQNAVCDVINHLPMCSCPHGMEGNALIQCRPVQRTFFLISSVDFTSFNSSFIKQP